MANAMLSFLKTIFKNSLSFVSSFSCWLERETFKRFTNDLFLTSLVIPFLLFSACTDEEADITQCLNGGACFAIEISDARTIACSCADGYTGTRCQLKAIDPDILG